MVYAYAPGRGGHHGEKALEGFCGTLQLDGYAGYKRLSRSDRPGGASRLARCWEYVAAVIVLRRDAFPYAEQENRPSLRNMFFCADIALAESICPRSVSTNRRFATSC